MKINAKNTIAVMALAHAAKKGNALPTKGSAADLMERANTCPATATLTQTNTVTLAAPFLSTVKSTVRPTLTETITLPVWFTEVQPLTTITQTAQATVTKPVTITAFSPTTQTVTAQATVTNPVTLTQTQDVTSAQTATITAFVTNTVTATESDTATVPGSTVTVPGNTVTAPGNTVTAAGNTVTVPGNTVTQPGATDTVPGETDTVPGATVTAPPTNTVTISGTSTVTSTVPMATVSVLDQTSPTYGGLEIDIVNSGTSPGCECGTTAFVLFSSGDNSTSQLLFPEGQGNYIEIRGANACAYQNGALISKNSEGANLDASFYAANGDQVVIQDSPHPSGNTAVDLPCPTTLGVPVS